MQMSDSEIVSRYRKAENQREQIKILSELNSCDENTIKNILLEGGVPEDELPKKRGPKPKAKEAEITEVAEVCPHCGYENTYIGWVVKKQGYIAVCMKCGKEIMLCDECMHAEDNKAQKCDQTCKGEAESTCFRGVIEGTEKTAEISLSALQFAEAPLQESIIPETVRELCERELRRLSVSMEKMAWRRDELINYLGDNYVRTKIHN